MDLNPSSTWNSILEKVKPHIPTIDLDSTTSENEDVVTVYQRQAGLSLQIHRDSDSFSIGSADLEELLKPIAQTCLSEETRSLCVTLDDDETVESTAATQQADACVDATVDLNIAELHLSVKQNVDNTKSYKDFPVLSFARLDQWDLDKVLQHLKKDELSLQQHVSADTVKTHANDDKDTYIMERLVAFCKSQSSVSEPVKSPNPIKQSNVQNVSLEKRAAEFKQNHQECLTVFIDLRCPDPPIKPPRIPQNPSSESVSPAKHNTQQGVPPARKPNPKVHTASPLNNREVTGKSMLLQKIREINKDGSKHLNKYANPPDSELGNEAEELKEKPLQPVEPTSDHNSENLWEDKQSSVEQSEPRKQKMGNPETVQQSSVREPKQHRDQQRQQLKQALQHKEHQKNLKQLEIHRPTKSVYQKQPAAERTDVLYDLEVSHLQSINMLPEDIKMNGCMLLIVSLSSPGMVGDRAHGKRKHLYTAATKSHIYNTLVAWFLSLVGPNPHHDEDKDVAKVPFWIAGLQQLWTENGLALHVLAVSRYCYTTRKRDKDIHAPFYNHVCRFLSETTLTQIAHWLPELQILLDKQAFAPLIHLPSSTLNCFVSATSNKKVIERTFCLSPGFYWQTVETQECVCKMRATSQELHTEVSYALGCSGLFLHPLITHYILQLINDAGIDVSGLRLLYPPLRFLTDHAGGAAVTQKDDETCQPVFVLAVRGPRAFSALQHLTSSLCPVLPKTTTSASHLQCRSQGSPLFYSPQLARQVHTELCLWFAGRLQGGSAQNHTQPPNRVVPLGDGDIGGLFNLSRSSAFLCATIKADVLLVVSPAVPSCCYGQVLAICEHRGFSLKGLQMLQLQSKGAALLRLTSQQAAVFCSSPTMTLSQEELELPSQCLVLLLRKENAMHHSVGLPAALMRDLKAQKLLGRIHSRRDGVQVEELHFCFHTVPYSSKLYHMFVKCMWKVPDPSAVILSHQKCVSNYDMEQVVILTLCGKDMSHGLSLLHQMLTEEPKGDAAHAGFKLLGLKWLPVLTQLQAQELSPYEVGEQLFNNSLDNLMSFPALVCALKGKNTFGSLRKLIPHNYVGNLSVLVSPTPQVALRQASLFFEHGTIHDPPKLLTVCLFKPGVWNHTLHKIFQKLQESGLMLVGMRVVALDKSDATSLLPTETDPSDVEAHIEYLCSGSSVAFCLHGENAVKRLLEFLCQEDSCLWTHCYDKAHLFNGVYGSGLYEKATEDVKRFFPYGLCCTETSTMRQEQIFSICSDPLASVERERICTLVSVAQKSRTPLVASGPNGGVLIHSALWQTTCLLIPLNAPLLSQVPFQLEMLLRSGCHLVAGRMTVLDHEQRQHISEILKVSSRGNDRRTQLYMAPCLIMALQGENIVTNIDSILQGNYKKSDLKQVRESIIYPECEKEAKQLICYLFDFLSPESCDIIVPQNANV